jgi:hypothetical protein
MLLLGLITYRHPVLAMDSHSGANSLRTLLE